VPTEVVDIADLQDQCQRSIERSRQRRLAAEEWRRTRFRRHGGTASLAATGVLVALGGGAAIGSQSDGAEEDASADAGESVAPAKAQVSTEGRLAPGGDALASAPLEAPSTKLSKARINRLQLREGTAVRGIGGLQTLAAAALADPEPVTTLATAPEPEAPQEQQQRPQPRQQAPEPRPTRAKRAPERSSDTGVQKAAAPASQGRGGSHVSGSLQRIAQCESGGNPRAIGGGGAYRGKYQFSPDTWRSLGGKGDPAQAPESEQDRRAAQLYSRSGAGQWPSCGQ